MKKIFAIIWKDTIVRFASTSEWLFFIILPLIFTFLLAGGSPSGNATNNRVRLVVVDLANTSISQNIVAELERSTAVYPDSLSLEEAEEQFEARRATAPTAKPAAAHDGTTQKRLQGRPAGETLPRARRGADQRLVEPRGHDRGDRQVVVLQHQHVTVASDADVGELNPRGTDARLLEVLDRAMVVRCVVRGLGGQNQDRNLL